jgi:hypothetical protein
MCSSRIIHYQQEQYVINTFYISVFVCLDL